LGEIKEGINRIAKAAKVTDAIGSRTLVLMIITLFRNCKL